VTFRISFTPSEYELVVSGDLTDGRV